RRMRGPWRIRLAWMRQVKWSSEQVSVTAEARRAKWRAPAGCRRRSKPRRNGMGPALATTIDPGRAKEAASARHAVRWPVAGGVGRADAAKDPLRSTTCRSDGL